MTLMCVAILYDFAQVKIIVLVYYSIFFCFVSVEKYDMNITMNNLIIFHLLILGIFFPKN